MVGDVVLLHDFPQMQHVSRGGNGAEKEALCDPRLTHIQHILFQYKKWLNPKIITFKNSDGETLWIATVYAVVKG